MNRSDSVITAFPVVNNLYAQISASFKTLSNSISWSSTQTLVNENRLADLGSIIDNSENSSIVLTLSTRMQSQYFPYSTSKEWYDTMTKVQHLLRQYNIEAGRDTINRFRESKNNEVMQICLTPLGHFVLVDAVFYKTTLFKYELRLNLQTGKVYAITLECPNGNVSRVQELAELLIHEWNPVTETIIYRDGNFLNCLRDNLTVQPKNMQETDEKSNKKTHQPSISTRIHKLVSRGEKDEVKDIIQYEVVSFTDPITMKRRRKEFKLPSPEEWDGYETKGERFAIDMYNKWYSKDYTPSRKMTMEQQQAFNTWKTGHA